MRPWLKLEEDVRETQVSGSISLLMLATLTQWMVEAIVLCVWAHAQFSKPKYWIAVVCRELPKVGCRGIHTVMFVLQGKLLDSNWLKISFCAGKLFLCSWTSKLAGSLIPRLSHSREVLVWDWDWVSGCVYAIHFNIQSWEQVVRKIIVECFNFGHPFLLNLIFH